jgi:hypothetical protein
MASIASSVLILTPRQHVEYVDGWDNGRYACLLSIRQAGDTITASGSGHSAYDNNEAH